MFLWHLELIDMTTVWRSSRDGEFLLAWGMPERCAPDPRIHTYFVYSNLTISNLSNGQKIVVLCSRPKYERIERIQKYSFRDKSPIPQQCAGVCVCVCGTNIRQTLGACRGKTAPKLGHGVLWSII